MATPGVRRSGRVSKKVPILLSGTDTAGRYFSEETHTVLLSRHGAGVISTNKPGPDEFLTLRVLASGQEAQVRLVGRMGGDATAFIYGVSFVDPALDFWRIPFPPPERYTSGVAAATEAILLECCLCQSRQEMSDSEIDADVYAVNQNILMHCESCGTSTIWKRAKLGATRNYNLPLGTVLPSPSPDSAASIPAIAASRQSLRPTAGAGPRPELPSFVSRLSTAPVAGTVPRRPAVAAHPVAAQAARLLTSAAPPSADAASLGSSSTVALAPAAPAPSSPVRSSTISVLSLAKPSFYSGASISPAEHVEEAFSDPANSSAGAPAPAPIVAAPPPVPRRPNRRKDVRTRVTFTACIRTAATGEEVVECDNISRGGFSFRSRSCYAAGSAIEAAVPYSPGGPAIFVLAHVQRVEELPGGLYRHGVSYDRFAHPVTPA